MCGENVNLLLVLPLALPQLFVVLWARPAGDLRKAIVDLAQPSMRWAAGCDALNLNAHH